MSARLQAYLIPYTWHPIEQQPYFLLPVVAEKDHSACQYTLSMLGGRCDPNSETVTECILREVCEETGTVLSLEAAATAPFYSIPWSDRHKTKGNINIRVFFVPVSNETALFEDPPTSAQEADLAGVAPPLKALWHLNQRINSHPFRNVTTAALEATDNAQRQAAETEILHMRSACAEASFTALFSYHQILAAPAFDTTHTSFEFDAAERRRQFTQAWKLYRKYRLQRDASKTCLWIELATLANKFYYNERFLEDLERDYQKNATNAATMIAKNIRNRTQQQSTENTARGCHCRMPAPSANGYYRRRH